MVTDITPFKVEAFSQFDMSIKSFYHAMTANVFQRIPHTRVRTTRLSGLHLDLKRRCANHYQIRANTNKLKSN